jgi:hypothetical protein
MRNAMIAGLVVLGLSSTAQARDTKLVLPIASVLSMPEAQGKILPDVTFSFGASPAPAGEARGEVVVNPKTNAANKSDDAACRWVMLTALIDLQDRARKAGANAVVNVESYYKKVVFSSATEFECHAGAFSAGVTLRGQMVKKK